MTEDDVLDELPPPNDGLFGFVVVAVLGVIVAGTLALAISTAVDAQHKTEMIQTNRVEFCQRLNRRFVKLDKAIHTVFPGTDPETLAGVKVFDDALRAEDCTRTFKLAAP